MKMNEAVQLLLGHMEEKAKDFTSVPRLSEAYKTLREAIKENEAVFGALMMTAAGVVAMGGEDSSSHFKLSIISMLPHIQEIAQLVDAKEVA